MEESETCRDVQHGLLDHLYHYLFYNASLFEHFEKLALISIAHSRRYFQFDKSISGNSCKCLHLTIGRWNHWIFKRYLSLVCVNYARSDLERRTVATYTANPVGTCWHAQCRSGVLLSNRFAFSCNSYWFADEHSHVATTVRGEIMLQVWRGFIEFNERFNQSEIYIINDLIRFTGQLRQAVSQSTGCDFPRDLDARKLRSDEERNERQVFTAGSFRSRFMTFTRHSRNWKRNDRWLVDELGAVRSECVC